MANESSYQVRGINWMDYAYRQYEDESAREEMYAHLTGVNANAVVLNNTYHVEPETGEIVSAWKVGDAYLGTKSDEEMVDVMRWFVTRGIDVVYKPMYQYFGRSLFQVDLAAEAFLDNYRKVILRDARMAEESGATILVIGTEFGEVTSLYEDKWSEILTDVKNIFTGALTYAANFNFGRAQFGIEGFNSTNEWPTIVFDEFLNYVGLNFYVGVPWDSESNKPYSGVPTYDQYMDALDDAEGGGISYLQYLRQISENSGKKILITESGNSANPPNGWEPDASRIDLDMQYDAYAAQFDSFMFYLKDVLIGTAGAQEFPTSSYEKFTNLADGYLAGSAMLGKPVEQLLRDYYSGALVDAGRVIPTSSTTSSVFGYSGNDKILMSDGSHNINAGDGIDTVVYDSTALPVGRVSGDWSVNGDTLVNVERVAFSDKSIALDVGATENAGIAKLFTGAIAHSVADDAVTLGVILDLVDNGYGDLVSLSQLAIDVGLIKSLAGSDSDQALAELVTTNVLGKSNSIVSETLTGYMDGTFAAMSQAEFMGAVAGLPLNQQHVDLTGLSQTGMEYVALAV